MSKYWFKRKRYGWGYVPVSWEGWLAVAIFIGVVTTAAVALPRDQPPPVKFFLLIFGAAGALLAVCYKKGPHPRWRWGRSPEDDPNEDL